MSISYIDEIYILFIDEPSKINLDSIRTFKEDKAIKINPFLRRSFPVSILDVPALTKTKLIKNNIAFVQKSVVDDLLLPSLKNHVTATFKNSTPYHEVKNILKDLNNDPNIKIAEFVDKVAIETLSGFPGNPMATCGAYDNISYMGDGYSYNYGQDSRLQYAYQWYLEPHGPSLPQECTGFNWENGTWDNSIRCWMEQNGTWQDGYNNCGIVEDEYIWFQNYEDRSDFFPYGETKRPSGISYLDAFKQFEIYPHPNSANGYNDNISDPVTIAVWDTMVDITHPNFHDPDNPNNNAIWQCPGPSNSCYIGEYGPGFTDFVSQGTEYQDMPDNEITGFCKSGDAYEFTPGLRCIKDCAGQCVPEKFLYDGICWNGDDSLFYLNNNWNYIQQHLEGWSRLSENLSPVLVATEGAGEIFNYWYDDEDFRRCKEENDGEMPEDQLESLAPNFNCDKFRSPVWSTNFDLFDDPYHLFVKHPNAGQYQIYDEDDLYGNLLGGDTCYLYNVLPYHEFGCTEEGEACTNQDGAFLFCDCNLECKARFRINWDLTEEKRLESKDPLYEYPIFEMFGEDIDNQWYMRVIAESDGWRDGECTGQFNCKEYNWEGGDCCPDTNKFKCEGGFGQSPQLGYSNDTSNFIEPWGQDCKRLTTADDCDNNSDKFCTWVNDECKMDSSAKSRTYCYHSSSDALCTDVADCFAKRSDISWMYTFDRSQSECVLYNPLQEGTTVYEYRCSYFSADSDLNYQNLIDCNAHYDWFTLQSCYDEDGYRHDCKPFAYDYEISLPGSSESYNYELCTEYFQGSWTLDSSCQDPESTFSDTVINNISHQEGERDASKGNVENETCISRVWRKLNASNEAGDTDYTNAQMQDIASGWMSDCEGRCFNNLDICDDSLICDQIDASGNWCDAEGDNFNAALPACTLLNNRPDCDNENILCTAEDYCIVGPHYGTWIMPECYRNLIGEDPPNNLTVEEIPLLSVINQPALDYCLSQQEDNSDRKRCHAMNNNTLLRSNICADGNYHTDWGPGNGGNGRTINLMCPKFGFGCGDCVNGYNEGEYFGPSLEEINSGTHIHNGHLITDPMNLCGTGYTPPDISIGYHEGGYQGDEYREAICRHCWDENKHCDCIGQCFDPSVIEGINSWLDDGICDRSKIFDDVTGDIVDCEEDNCDDYQYTLAGKIESGEIDSSHPRWDYQHDDAYKLNFFCKGNSLPYTQSGGIDFNCDGRLGYCTCPQYPDICWTYHCEGGEYEGMECNEGWGDWDCRPWEPWLEDGTCTEVRFEYGPNCPRLDEMDGWSCNDEHYNTFSCMNAYNCNTRPAPGPIDHSDGIIDEYNVRYNLICTDNKPTDCLASVQDQNAWQCGYAGIEALCYNKKIGDMCGSYNSVTLQSCDQPGYEYADGSKCVNTREGICDCRRLCVDIEFVGYDLIEEYTYDPDEWEEANMDIPEGGWNGVQVIENLKIPTFNKKGNADDTTSKIQDGVCDPMSYTQTDLPSFECPHYGCDGGVDRYNVSGVRNILQHRLARVKDHWGEDWNPLIHSWNWVDSDWGTDFCHYDWENPDDTYTNCVAACLSAGGCSGITVNMPGECGIWEEDGIHELENRSWNFHDLVGSCMRDFTTVCPFGFIKDCNGECVNIDFYGTAICYDGSWQYNFNCAELGYGGSYSPSPVTDETYGSGFGICKHITGDIGDSGTCDSYNGMWDSNLGICYFPSSTIRTNQFSDGSLFSPQSLYGYCHVDADKEFNHYYLNTDIPCEDSLPSSGDWCVTDNLWKCDVENTVCSGVNSAIRNSNVSQTPFFTGEYPVGQCVSSFSDQGPRWILYKNQFLTETGFQHASISEEDWDWFRDARQGRLCTHDYECNYGDYYSDGETLTGPSVCLFPYYKRCPESLATDDNTKEICGGYEPGENCEPTCRSQNQLECPNKFWEFPHYNNNDLIAIDGTVATLNDPNRYVLPMEASDTSYYQTDDAEADDVPHICASSLIGCLQSASFLPHWGENLWHTETNNLNTSPVGDAATINDKYIKADTIRGRCDQYEYYYYGEESYGPYRMIEDCNGHCVPEHFFYKYAEQDGFCFQGSRARLEADNFNPENWDIGNQGYGWSLWKYLNETDRRVREVNNGKYDCGSFEGVDCYPGRWEDGICEEDSSAENYFYAEIDYLWMNEPLGFCSNSDYDNKVDCLLEQFDWTPIYDVYAGGGNGQFSQKEIEYLAAYSNIANWKQSPHPLYSEPFITKTIKEQMGCYVPNFDCPTHIQAWEDKFVSRSSGQTFTLPAIMPYNNSAGNCVNYGCTNPCAVNCNSSFCCTETYDGSPPEDHHACVAQYYDADGYLGEYPEILNPYIEGLCQEEIYASRENGSCCFNVNYYLNNFLYSDSITEYDDVKYWDAVDPQVYDDWGELLRDNLSIKNFIDDSDTLSSLNNLQKVKIQYFDNDITTTPGDFSNVFYDEYFGEYVEEDLVLNYIDGFNPHIGNARLVLADEFWYQSNTYLWDNTNYLPPYHFIIYNNDSSGTAAWDLYFDQASNHVTSPSLCLPPYSPGCTCENCGDEDHDDYKSVCCGQLEVYSEDPYINILFPEGSITDDSSDFKIYADISLALDMCGTDCMNPYALWPNGGTTMGCVLGIGGIYFTTNYNKNDEGNWIDWDDFIYTSNVGDGWVQSDGICMDGPDCLVGDDKITIDTDPQNTFTAPDRPITSQIFNITYIDQPPGGEDCYRALVEGNCISWEDATSWNDGNDKRNLINIHFGEGPIGEHAFAECNGLSTELITITDWYGEDPYPDDYQGLDMHTKPFTHCNNQGECLCNAIPVSHGIGDVNVSEKRYACIGEINEQFLPYPSDCNGACASDNDLTYHLINDLIHPSCSDYNHTTCSGGGGNQVCAKPEEFSMQNWYYNGICTTSGTFSQALNDVIRNYAINYIPSADDVQACDECCLFNSAEGWDYYFTERGISEYLFDLDTGGGAVLHWDGNGGINDIGSWINYGVYSKEWYGRYGLQSHGCSGGDCFACSVTPDCAMFGDCCPDIISHNFGTGNSACGSADFYNFCGGVCQNSIDFMIEQQIIRMCDSTQSQYDAGEGYPFDPSILAGTPCILNRMNESKNVLKIATLEDEGLTGLFCDRKVYAQWNNIDEGINISGVNYGYYDCNGVCFNPNNCWLGEEIFEDEFYWVEKSNAPCNWNQSNNEYNFCESNNSCSGTIVDLSCCLADVHFGIDYDGDGVANDTDDWTAPTIDDGYFETDFWKTDNNWEYVLIGTMETIEPEDYLGEMFTCCGGVSVIDDSEQYCHNYEEDGYYLIDGNQEEVICKNCGHLRNCFEATSLYACTDPLAVNVGQLSITMHGGDMPEEWFDMSRHQCWVDEVEGFGNECETDINNFDDYGRGRTNKSCYKNCYSDNRDCEYNWSCQGPVNPFGAGNNCCQRGGECSYGGDTYDCSDLYADCNEIVSQGSGNCIPHQDLFSTEWDAYFNPEFTEGNNWCDGHLFNCPEWYWDLGDCVCQQCDCNGSMSVTPGTTPSGVSIRSGKICFENNTENLEENQDFHICQGLDDPTGCYYDQRGMHCIRFDSSYDSFNDYNLLDDPSVIDDGHCDDGVGDYPNLRCSTFNYDGGDCCVDYGCHNCDFDGDYCQNNADNWCHQAVNQGYCTAGEMYCTDNADCLGFHGDTGDVDGEYDHLLNTDALTYYYCAYNSVGGDEWGICTKCDRRMRDRHGNQDLTVDYDCNDPEGDILHDDNDECPCRPCYTRPWRVGRVFDGSTGECCERINDGPSNYNLFLGNYIFPDDGEAHGGDDCDPYPCDWGSSNIKLDYTNFDLGETVTYTWDTNFLHYKEKQECLDVGDHQNDHAYNCLHMYNSDGSLDWSDGYIYFEILDWRGDIIIPGANIAAMLMMNGEWRGCTLPWNEQNLCDPICLDGADPWQGVCGEGQYECGLWIPLPGNGQCISEDQLCNGADDCDPNYDEINTWCCGYWRDKGVTDHETYDSCTCFNEGCEEPPDDGCESWETACPDGTCLADMYWCRGPFTNDNNMCDDIGWDIQGLAVSYSEDHENCCRREWGGQHIGFEKYPCEYCNCAVEKNDWNFIDSYNLCTTYANDNGHSCCSHEDCGSTLGDAYYCDKDNKCKPCGQYNEDGILTSGQSCCWGPQTMGGVCYGSAIAGVDTGSWSNCGMCPCLDRDIWGGDDSTGCGYAESACNWGFENMYMENYCYWEWNDCGLHEGEGCYTESWDDYCWIIVDQNFCLQQQSCEWDNYGEYCYPTSEFGYSYCECYESDGFGGYREREVSVNPSRYSISEDDNTGGDYLGISEINNGILRCDHGWEWEKDECWDDPEYYNNRFLTAQQRMENKNIPYEHQLRRKQQQYDSIKNVPFDDIKHKKFTKDIYDSIYHGGKTTDNFTRTKSGDVIGGEGGDSTRHDWWYDRSKSDAMMYSSKRIHSSHGTQVAGIIGARTVYDEGLNWNSNRDNAIAGLCSTCKIVPLSLNEMSGIGMVATIEYIRANFIDIVNMSWSCVNRDSDECSQSCDGGCNVPCSQTLKSAMQTAATDESFPTLFITSAGNSGPEYSEDWYCHKNTQAEKHYWPDVMMEINAHSLKDEMIAYPGGYDFVMTVGALNKSNQAATFTNYGRTLNISAPGVAIVTTNSTFTGGLGTSHRRDTKTMPNGTEFPSYYPMWNGAGGFPDSDQYLQPVGVNVIRNINTGHTTGSLSADERESLENYPEKGSALPDYTRVKYYQEMYRISSDAKKGANSLYHPNGYVSHLSDDFMWVINEGTSFSAPIVSGVAGMVLSRFKEVPGFNVHSLFDPSGTKGWCMLAPQYLGEGYNNYFTTRDDCLFIPGAKGEMWVPGGILESSADNIYDICHPFGSEPNPLNCRINDMYDSYYDNDGYLWTRTRYDYLTDQESYWDGLARIVGAGQYYNPNDPIGLYTNWNRGTLGKGKVNALSAMSRACEWTDRADAASSYTLAKDYLPGNAGDGCATLSGCLDVLAVPCNRYMGDDGLEYCHYDSPYGCFCGDGDIDPNTGLGIPLETSTIIYHNQYMCRYVESPLCQWCIDWCAYDGADGDYDRAVGDCRIPSPYDNTNNICYELWETCLENNNNDTDLCGDADTYLDICFYNNMSLRTTKAECKRINESVGNLEPGSWDFEDLWYHRCSEEEPHIGGPNPIQACYDQCLVDNDPAEEDNIYWTFDFYKDIGLVDAVTGEWLINADGGGCWTTEDSVRESCCIAQCNDYINHPIRGCRGTRFYAGNFSLTDDWNVSNPDTLYHGECEFEWIDNLEDCEDAGGIWTPYEGYIPFTILDCRRGCTNQVGTGTTYDPEALYDDGSCVLNVEDTTGCIDPVALNYNCRWDNFEPGACNCDWVEADDGQYFWVPKMDGTQMTIPSNTCNYGGCESDEIQVYCCLDNNPATGDLIGELERNHWGVGNGICDGSIPEYQCNTQTDCLSWGYYAECRLEGQATGNDCLNGQIDCDAIGDGSECVTNMIGSVDGADTRLGCCGYPGEGNSHIEYNETVDSYGCSKTTAVNYEEGITIPCNLETHTQNCQNNGWSYDDNTGDYVDPSGARSQLLEFTNDCCCEDYQTNSDAHKFKIHYKYSQVEVTSGTAFYYDNGNYSTPKYDGGIFITGVVPIDENEKLITGTLNNPGFMVHASFHQDDGSGFGVPEGDCPPGGDDYFYCCLDPDVPNGCCEDENGDIPVDGDSDCYFCNPEYNNLDCLAYPDIFNNNSNCIPSEGTAWCHNPRIRLHNALSTIDAWGYCQEDPEKPCVKNGPDEWCTNVGLEDPTCINPHFMKPKFSGGGYNGTWEINPKNGTETTGDSYHSYCNLDEDNQAYHNCFTDPELSAQCYADTGGSCILNTNWNPMWGVAANTFILRFTNGTVLDASSSSYNHLNDGSTYGDFQIIQGPPEQPDMLSTTIYLDSGGTFQTPGYGYCYGPIDGTAENTGIPCLQNTDCLENYVCLDNDKYYGVYFINTTSGRFRTPIENQTADEGSENADTLYLDTIQKGDYIIDTNNGMFELKFDGGANFKGKIIQYCTEDCDNSGDCFSENPQYTTEEACEEAGGFWSQAVKGYVQTYNWAGQFYTSHCTDTPELGSCVAGGRFTQGSESDTVENWCPEKQVACIQQDDTLEFCLGNKVTSGFPNGKNYQSELPPGYNDFHEVCAPNNGDMLFVYNSGTILEGTWEGPYGDNYYPAYARGKGYLWDCSDVSQDDGNTACELDSVEEQNACYYFWTGDNHYLEDPYYSGGNIELETVTGNDGNNYKALSIPSAVTIKSYNDPGCSEQIPEQPAENDVHTTRKLILRGNVANQYGNNQGGWEVFTDISKILEATIGMSLTTEYGYLRADSESVNKFCELRGYDRGEIIKKRFTSGPSQRDGGNSEVYWNSETEQWNILSSGCEDCEFFLTHQGYNIFYTDTSWKGYYQNIDSTDDGTSNVDTFKFFKNTYGYNEEHPAHDFPETSFTLKHQNIAYAMAEYDDEGNALPNAYLQACCTSTIWGDNPWDQIFFDCDCGPLEGFNEGNWNSPVNGEDYQYYEWPNGSDTTEDTEIIGPEDGYVWATCENSEGCLDIDLVTYNMVCQDSDGNDTGDTSEQDCCANGCGSDGQNVWIMTDKQYDGCKNSNGDSISCDGLIVRNEDGTIKTPQSFRIYTNYDGTDSTRVVYACGTDYELCKNYFAENGFDATCNSNLCSGDRATVDVRCYDEEEIIPTFMSGDVNLDGGSNILDIVALINYILDDGATADVLSRAQKRLIDMNQDDIFNVLDVVALVQSVLAEGSPNFSGKWPYNITGAGQSRTFNNVEPPPEIPMESEILCNSCENTQFNAAKICWDPMNSGFGICACPNTGGYIGGDFETVDDLTLYLTETYFGNGVCNEEFNCNSFEWDYGDCHVSTVSILSRWFMMTNRNWNDLQCSYGCNHLSANGEFQTDYEGEGPVLYHLQLDGDQIEEDNYSENQACNFGFIPNNVKGISLWFRLPSNYTFTGNIPATTILQLENEFNNLLSLGLIKNGANVIPYFSSVDDNNMDLLMSSTQGIGLDEWNHLSIFINDESPWIEMYVNGEKQTIEQFTTDLVVIDDAYNNISFSNPLNKISIGNFITISDFITEENAFAGSLTDVQIHGARYDEFENYVNFSLLKPLLRPGDSAMIGCTDPDACNYIDTATIPCGGNNDCCEWPIACWDHSEVCPPDLCPEQISGCTDDGACNYDDEANTDDGSCDYSCIGCMEEDACNYDSEATIPDSCDYTNCCRCKSSCFNALADVNGDGLINVSDVVMVIGIILNGGECGEDNICECYAADVNEDGVINVLDVVAMLDLILGGGSQISLSKERKEIRALKYVRDTLNSETTSHNLEYILDILKPFASKSFISRRAEINVNRTNCEMVVNHCSTNWEVNYNCIQLSEHMTHICGCECIPDIPGCTDQEACNYNREASIDDGSCTYAWYECWNGETYCEPRECPEQPPHGQCNDWEACNWMAPATCWYAYPDGVQCPDGRWVCYQDECECSECETHSDCPPMYFCLTGLAGEQSCCVFDINHCLATGMDYDGCLDMGGLD